MNIHRHRPMWDVNFHDLEWLKSSVTRIRWTGRLNDWLSGPQTDRLAWRLAATCPSRWTSDRHWCCYYWVSGKVWNAVVPKVPKSDVDWWLIYWPETLQGLGIRVLDERRKTRLAEWNICRSFLSFQTCKYENHAAYLEAQLLKSN